MHGGKSSKKETEKEVNTQGTRHRHVRLAVKIIIQKKQHGVRKVGAFYIYTYTYLFIYFGWIMSYFLNFLLSIFRQKKKKKKKKIEKK